jgi:hypothetical protein
MDPKDRSPRMRPIRTYMLVVLGIFVLVDLLAGPYVQAWYRTMPPEHAKALGGLILLGLFIIVGVGALFVISRSSDA